MVKLKALAMACVGSVLAASTLVGCSNRSGDRLIVWHEFTGSADTAMQEVMKGFNDSSTDAEIQDRPIANDQFFTALRTGLSGPRPPDIVQYEGYNQTADFAKAGELTDLTQWWRKHKSAFSFTNSLTIKRACTYRGRVYCIPWYLHSSNQLYYNPDILAKYHLRPPRTMNQLLSAVKVLKQAGVTPISLYSSDGWPASQWWDLLSIERCGVSVVYKAIEQRGAKWNDSCFLQATKDLQRLANAGAFPDGVAGSDSNSMYSLFYAGKAAFMNTGTWMEQTLAQTPAPFHVGIGPFPQVSGPGDGQYLGGVQAVFAIPAKSTHHARALQFFDYLAHKAPAEQFAKASTMMLVKGANVALPKSLQKTWQGLDASLRSSGGRNMVTYFENELDPSVGENVIYVGSTAVASGQESPETFVRDLQAAAAKAAS